MIMFKRVKDKIQMWDYYIANYLSRKTISFQRSEPNTASLRFNRLDFNQSNSVFFVVESYAQNVLFGFISNFKDFVEDKADSVVLNTYTKFSPYRIDWNSPQMQARLNTWNERRTLNESIEQNAFTLKDTYESTESDRWLQRTIEYLYLSEQKNDNVTLGVTVFLQLINHDTTREGLSTFKNIIDSLIQHAALSGVFLRQITTELSEFLTSELPFAFKEQRVNHYTKFVINNDILAKNYNVRQGEIGDGGIYIGTDIYSRRGIFKVFKKTDVSAEVVFVTGETGSGKSLLVKTLICQLLAEGHYGLIDDVEGDEYDQLVQWVVMGDKEGAISINMRKGGFVDPVPIPDLVGDASIDSTLKGQSLTYTRLMLNILIGDRILNSSEWMDIILSELITTLYRTIGVTEEQDTWNLSKNYSIRDVCPILKRCIDSNEVFPSLEGLITPEEFKRCATLIYAKLQRFFAHDGSESYLFSEPINIDEINRARLVQLQYNMKATANNIVDPVQMELMLLNSSIVSFQRSLYCKYKLKKFNFKVKEEVQRWSVFPNADAILNVEVTGGRKMGDIILMVTNAPGTMLNSKNEVLSGIFTNCTSYLIGALKDAKLRYALLDRISALHLEDELTKISVRTLEKMDKRDSNAKKTYDPYQFGFIVCLDKINTGVGKVMLPDTILQSKLFKTGVHTEEGD